MSKQTDIQYILKLAEVAAKFRQIWITGNNIRWGQQFKDKITGRLDYYPREGQPLDKDFIDHFSMDPVKPVSTRQHYKGALAFKGRFERDLAMWFCADADDSKSVDDFELKLIPQLEKEKIDYLWEYSGEKGDRCHIWFMLDHVPLKLLQDYMKQVFEDAGLRKPEYECFPTNRPDNYIRLPGVHLKTFKINAIRRLDGEESNDPLFLMESFLGLPRYDEKQIRERLRVPEARPFVPKRKILRRGPFYYTEVKLETYPDLPPAVKTMASNCQAINRLLKESVEDGLINKAGGMNHNAGLYLFNMALYSDVVTSKPWKRETSGKSWADRFFGKYRYRPYESHKWDYALGKTDISEAAILVPKCSTFERDFDYCKGCPLKNRAGFMSPRQLIGARPVTRTLAREVSLVGATQIRETTFKTVKNRIINLAQTGGRKKIQLKSPQGGGKSFLMDDIAIELSRLGFNVLIACPTGDLAMEHSRRIASEGSHAFNLMSVKNHFLKNNPGFDCPNFLDILNYSELGVGSTAIKKAFCGNCPFENQCRYPKQYAQMQEAEHKIVICQHSHFASEEAMNSIHKKKFDVLMIDEVFTDKVLTEIKATEIEWTLLETVDWAQELQAWMRDGGYPRTILRPNVEQLATLKETFDNHMAPWRIPEFLRAYNNEYFMDKHIGLHVFHAPPVKNIPITFLTDATASLEMLRIYLDDQDIEVYGDDEVLDYTLMNPENKVIQTLDASVSKTYLQGQKCKDDEGNDDWDYGEFIEMLEFIGDKASTEYKDKSILITTYKSHKKLAEDWLSKNYPEIMDRVLISWMKVGTNEFDKYEVQFLLAGVYFNTKQFHKQVFELKTVANYWNRQNDRPLISNFFWWGVADNAELEREDEPVRRIHREGDVTGVFEYGDFKYRRPADYYYNLIEKLAIAKTQQAIRLRFNDSTQKIVYIFAKYFLPSFLITHSYLKEELFGYLRGN